MRRFGGKISAGTVSGDPDLWRGGCCHDGSFQGQWCGYSVASMAKEVGAVMIVWELWHGTVTREAFMERDEMIFLS